MGEPVFYDKLLLLLPTHRSTTLQIFSLKLRDLTYFPDNSIFTKHLCFQFLLFSAHYLTASILSRVGSMGVKKMSHKGTCMNSVNSSEAQSSYLNNGSTNNPGTGGNRGIISAERNNRLS